MLKEAKGSDRQTNGQKRKIKSNTQQAQVDWKWAKIVNSPAKNGFGWQAKRLMTILFTDRQTDTFVSLYLSNPKFQRGGHLGEKSDRFCAQNYTRCNVNIRRDGVIWSGRPVAKTFAVSFPCLATLSVSGTAITCSRASFNTVIVLQWYNSTGTRRTWDTHKYTGKHTYKAISVSDWL